MTLNFDIIRYSLKEFYKMETKMTFDEVMAAMGVKTRQTIYNYIERGLLTPIKTFNNRVYFDNREIERLLEPLKKRLGS